MFSCIGLGTIIQTTWVGKTTFSHRYYPSYHLYPYGLRLINLTVITLCCHEISWYNWKISNSLRLRRPLSVWKSQLKISKRYKFANLVVTKPDVYVLDQILSTPGSVQFRKSILAFYPRRQNSIILVNCKKSTNFRAWSPHNTDTSNTIKLPHPNNQI